MAQPEMPAHLASVRDVALIVVGALGISSSFAKLFANSGGRVAIAARTLRHILHGKFIGKEMQ